MDGPTSSHGWRNALIAGLAAGAAFLGLALATGFNPIDIDIKYDWLSVTGAVRSDAYADVLDLAREFDVPLGALVPPGVSTPGAHPRTPGAILLAIPLLLFDYDRLFAVATFLTVATGLLILWPVLRTADRKDRVALLILAAISAPTFMTLRYASQSALVAALVLFAWPLLFRGRGLAGGWMLAVAGVLKIFPLILLVPLLLRRRYLASGVTIGGFLILNAGGLALPGVSLAGAWKALVAASATWIDMGANGSLVTVVHGLGVSQRVSQVLVAGLLGLFLTFALRRRKERVMNDPLPWIISGLLVIPLSWIAYDLVIMPGLASLFLANTVRLRLVGMAGWALWIAPMLVYPFFLVDLGVSSVVIRLMLLAVWWIGWLSWTDRGWRSIWVTPPSRAQAETKLST